MTSTMHTTITPERICTAYAWARAAPAKASPISPSSSPVVVTRSCAACSCLVCIAAIDSRSASPVSSWIKRRATSVATA
jgi:hypothetical protein